MSAPIVTDLCLSAEQLVELAYLIADRLEGCREVRPALVGVREVAAYLAVDASWVYEHAREIGARKLGDGPKARLRFSLAEVDQKLSACMMSRKSTEAQSRMAESKRRRARTRRLGTTVELLPIRGAQTADFGLSGDVAA